MVHLFWLHGLDSRKMPSLRRYLLKQLYPFNRQVTILSCLRLNVITSVITCRNDFLIMHLVFLLIYNQISSFRWNNLYIKKVYFYFNVIISGYIFNFSLSFYLIQFSSYPCDFNVGMLTGFTARDFETSNFHYSFRKCME